MALDLPAHTLSVWMVHLDTTNATALDAARALLSDGERARADRLIAPVLGARFTLARAALRRILGAVTGRDPAALTFTTGPHGKPHLAHGAPPFNLSHSGDFAAIAVSPGPEVGIDIERIDPRRATADLAARCFTPVENAALAATPEGEPRTAAFFRIWSRKEAVIKALGEGLTCPLDSFDVSAAPGEARLLALRRPGATPAAWTLFALDDLAPGYTAATAIIGPCPTIIHHNTLP
jgi:4'-phosphopantetheinyl transferase